ncbi:MAG: hypothetical protein H0W61_01030 [Bacteroidetes bacterium]|nr:hypothetical protein [Bacteroidota bacterium]
MEGLQTAIPRRLFYLRTIVTLGIFISFFLSMNLWGGGRYFPSIPVFEQFHLTPPFDYVLVIVSALFLLASLLFRNTRMFIFLSLLINVFLLLLDLNRLQPWFFVYNAVLIVFLFYNGRVDNSNKFTSVFIFIQMIVASVYVYNGVSQLMNPIFIETDFNDIILPLKKVVSERQFIFFLKTGKVVPYVMIFIGIGLLFRQVKYLAISLGLCMHLFLFVLLFPSAGNSNYALWFMNLVFGTMIILLFSGKTQQRYFSYSFLFQKPLFYLILLAFWVMPAFNHSQRWPDALSSNFKSGASGKEKVLISKNVYEGLPNYIRSFCSPHKEGQYVLKLDKWCGHELRSEYFNHEILMPGRFKEAMQIVTAGAPLPEDELSVKR